MDPRRTSDQEICGALKSPRLNFVGAERGYADLGHPDRHGYPLLNFGDLLRPLLDLPQIPVQRETMHRDRIDVIEHTARFHVLHEAWIDRRDAAEHTRKRRV